MSSGTALSRLVLAAVAGSVLIPAASASAAAVAVETLDAASPVAAYAGTAMWSRRDPATGRFRLVQATNGGAPTVVAVAERGGPFDVDLGTNRGGSTYAVYSREGDLFRLDPRSGAETKLTGLSSPRLAEHDPTIQRGEIAFLRRDDGTDQLRIGSTSPGATATRLLTTGRLISAELGVKHIAYLEAYYGIEGLDRRLRVRNLTTGRDQVLAHANSGGLNDASITKPSFTGEPASFVWARTNPGSGTGNRIVRYTLRTAAFSYAQGSPRYASTAWVNDHLGAVISTDIDATTIDTDGKNECRDAGVELCRVAYTGPLSFTLRP